MFERVRSWFQGEQKQSKTGAALITGSRDAEWSPRRFDSFADEGYTKNVVAYQSINRVANAVADIPLIILNTRSETEVTDGTLVSLLARPNPVQSYQEWMRALVGFYLISGNGYMERVMVGSQPRELYTLRPDRMTVKPSDTGLPEGYKYTVGGRYVSWDAHPMTGMSDIRHIKAFNPLNDWYGLSPIEAGAFAVDQHNESMQWLQSLLQNGAAPSGAMEMQKDASGSFGDLTDEQFNRLKTDIDEQYVGAKNAGRPMLLEGGLKWTQMGLSPQQMSIIDLKYSSARDIALAIGVPPMLLNIPGDNTFSNYKEARLSLYEDTAIPLARYIVGELNNWLAPMFGDQFKIDLDLDAIPAIAEKRREMWTMADSSNDLTINERREIKGYQPIDGGDAVFIPSSMVPLDFASAPIDVPDVSPDELRAMTYGPDNIKNDSYEPPKGVREAASQGLEYRREYGRGGTETGIARARDLSNGKSVSLETINRMVSFFARHEENRVPPSEKTESDGGPTNGWIAHMLWGGDPGRRWAEKIAAQEDDD